jgi:prolyl-tRNA synthetase
MRLSKLFTKTRREAPKDETSASAQLLTRAGFIYKEAAGVYQFLPLGLRVLRNIEQVVREEMNKAGGQELLLSTLQRQELWEKTGRWDDNVVDNWFKTELKNGTAMGLGFSHEEPLTDMLREYVNSYRDLPLTVYQIQTKFRNELRAKSGIMRGREFLMKDMYTFARSQEEHEKLYDQIKMAYIKVFDRLGLGERTFVTFASGGSFSKYSDEFQTLTDAGEDVIYLDRAKRVAVNNEVLEPGILKELGLVREELEEVKAAEVGNIFTLGTKYSAPLGLVYSDEDGKEQPILMGCYGIGISRLVGVIAECLSDENGLVWPEGIGPADVHLVRIGEDEEVVKAADKLYDDLMKAGKSVLYDDRDERAGTKFADADLIGVGKRITVSPKTLAEHSVEFKLRTKSEPMMVKLADIAKHI